MKDKCHVHLSLVTCLTNNSNTFNYNIRGFKLEEMNISEGLYFIRNNNYKIKTIAQHSEIQTEKGEELLFRIRKSKNNNFTIENPICNIEKTKNGISNLTNKLWYILSNKNTNNNIEDYILNKNDIIQFGESKYEIIEKHIEEKDKNGEDKKDIDKNGEDKKDIDKNGENNNNNINYVDLKDKYNIIKNNKSESIFKNITIKNIDYSNKNTDNLCRICFEGSSSIDNPKIILCNCHDYIHYECLKSWIKTKIIKRENAKKTVVSYNIKKFICEVCLKTYPFKFTISELNKEYSLIDLHYPIGYKYIVLESLGLVLDNNDNVISKLIHIVKLTGDNIIIGRKDYCDIAIMGNNVSREHAIIKYTNGDVFLENKSETLNTLVLVKRPIVIKENKIDLQVGRTIITANLINNENIKENIILDFD